MFVSTGTPLTVQHGIAPPRVLMFPSHPPSQLPTHHTLSLHPVKLLGFLLSCLLVPSLEGFSLPFLPSLPSSHIQLLFHPSDTSLPSLHLLSCGPLAMGSWSPQASALSSMPSTKEYLLLLLKDKNLSVCT